MGRGHYGHRLLFDDAGFLWISSGERQKFTPAQDLQTNLGKVLRLRDDGSVPEDNPFVHDSERDPLVDDEGICGQIWSLGHRNPLGIAFALAAGLSSRAIVRIEIDGDKAREAARYDLGARIRSVVEGPDGALWVLEDERGDSGGRLLRLTPND